MNPPAVTEIAPSISIRAYYNSCFGAWDRAPTVPAPFLPPSSSPSQIRPLVHIRKLVGKKKDYIKQKTTFILNSQTV